MKSGMLARHVTEPVCDRSSRGILVDSRLVNVRFLALFAANLAMGLFFGGIGVAITAFAIAHGAGALAGVISAAGGVVSLSVGLAYGALERGRPVKTMIAAGGILAVGCALLALAPNLPVMIVGYGLVGGCVALVLIPGSILLQRTTASGAYTQAMTWINSASAIGIATSAPLVGYVIQVHTWAAGFLGLAALTALLPVTLLVAYPVLGRMERRR